MSFYPADLPITLDESAELLAEGTALLGGEPLRFIRLTSSGARALAKLRTKGAGSDVALRALARSLVDAGLAHPRPPLVKREDITVVIPVCDRPLELGTCLAAAGSPAVVVDDGSRNEAAIAEVCERYGARLIRRDISGGPAAARNSGLAIVETSLVAFIDSDCVLELDWFERLGGHFRDPRVAAVAPRVRAVSSDDGPVGRFAVARSPIDLGTRPARVVPMGRVSYVPSATLLMRRTAIDGGFDERLRVGEDVDLVWRLHGDGMTVRFDPSVAVFHHEPTRWRDLVSRHFRYGTGAARLAQRHPGRLSPLVLAPNCAAIAAAALSGRPRLAAAIVAGCAARLPPSSRRAGITRRRTVGWLITGAWKMTLGLGHFLTTYCPWLLLALVTKRRTRGAAVFLVVAPPTVEWLERRPALDPLRWMILAIADDAEYGLGVWVGCVRERTLDPVLPTFIRHQARRGQPQS